MSESPRVKHRARPFLLDEDSIDQKLSDHMRGSSHFYRQPEEEMLLDYEEEDEDESLTRHRSHIEQLVQEMRERQAALGSESRYSALAS